MNIAIADDRVEDLQAAEDYLLRYFSSRHPEVMNDLSISTFPNAERFLEVFDPGRFDLLLLDIYMEDMTGMEAAEAVRLKDDRVPIVFLTTSQDHLLEGYRVFASGYLMKPLAENAGEFNHTLDHVFKGMMKSERTLTAPVEGREVKIPLRKIVYVETGNSHCLAFHQTEEVAQVRLPYARVQDMLSGDERFLECHHRIIINMEQVRRMEAEEFIMKDGSRVPISQRRKKEAKTAYMHYIAHR